jgi:hypothetical protein
MAPKKNPAGKMDMQTIMKIYQKAGTPGAPHERLARLAGSWTTRTTSWMEPGKPPVESTGTCRQKMILDGRFLQQDYSGKVMGMTFKGINIIGYDNHTKKYVSVWVDSMSTGIYFFEGAAGRGGKVITQESSYDDPVRGPMTWRSISRIVDDNTMTYEMVLIPPKGPEEKMMEMTMTRK